MQENFNAALLRILVYEGGKVDNPKDPGGRTNMGITQNTYNNWLRKQNKNSVNVYNITKDEVSAIYKGSYWTPCGADKLPNGLDLVVFDGAVNSGIAQSVSWLQAALGGIVVDGSFGDRTEAAAAICNSQDIIDSYCQRRLATLQRLKTWSAFGKGWSARITNVHKIADAWSAEGKGANIGPSPVDISSLGGNQKARLTDIKISPISQVATHTVTVGSATGTVVTQAIQTITPVSETFDWLKYILGGLTLVGAASSVAVLLAKNANDAAFLGSKTTALDNAADENLTPVPVIDVIETTTIPQLVVTPTGIVLPEVSK